MIMIIVVVIVVIVVIIIINDNNKLIIITIIVIIIVIRCNQSHNNNDVVHEPMDLGSHLVTECSCKGPFPCSCSGQQLAFLRPSAASLWVKRLCRTGFEKETCIQYLRHLESITRIQKKNQPCNTSTKCC